MWRCWSQHRYRYQDINSLLSKVLYFWDKILNCNSRRCTYSISILLDEKCAESFRLTKTENRWQLYQTCADLCTQLSTFKLSGSYGELANQTEEVWLGRPTRLRSADHVAVLTLRESSAFASTKTNRRSSPAFVYIQWYCCGRQRLLLHTCAFGKLGKDANFNFHCNCYLDLMIT